MCPGHSLRAYSPDRGTQFGDQQVTAVIRGIGPSFTPSTVFLGNRARGVTVMSRSGDELSIAFTTAGTPTPGTPMSTSFRWPERWLAR